MKNQNFDFLIEKLIIWVPELMEYLLYVLRIGILLMHL